MFSVVIVALFACAYAQTRPNISESFYAEVRTELHQAGNTLFGEGRWAIDEPANLGVEDYKFEDTRAFLPLYVYDLERYDIGKIFSINSHDQSGCQVQDVTGNFPSQWGWVANARYTGEHLYHGLTIETWTANFAGVALTVGVHAPDYNTPFIFNRESVTESLYIEFYRFDPTNNFNHSIFDIPQQCASTSVFVPPPARPNPAEDFEAEVQVEVLRNGATVYGEGRMASDQTQNMFVEEFDLRDPHTSETIRVLNLERYDTGKQYLIDSKNSTDCHIKDLTGSMPAFWDWLTSATYLGQRTVRDYGLLDIWNYNAGGVNLTLAVRDNDINTPLFLAKELPSSDIKYYIRRWDATQPNPNDFEVPHECL